MAINRGALEHKYKNEIHCNELAILPYYIANLNIEYTYQQKMGKYEEFKNICLVDTLENTVYEGKQGNQGKRKKIIEKMCYVARPAARTVSM